MTRRAFIVKTAQVSAAASSLPLLLNTAVRAQSDEGPVKIGFALPTLSQYRWQFDQRFFEEAVAANGDEVIVQAGNDDERLQASQVQLRQPLFCFGRAAL